jgi:hypothetical protein
VLAWRLHWARVPPDCPSSRSLDSKGLSEAAGSFAFCSTWRRCHPTLQPSRPELGCGSCRDLPTLHPEGASTPNVPPIPSARPTISGAAVLIPLSRFGDSYGVLDRHGSGLPTCPAKTHRAGRRPRPRHPAERLDVDPGGDHYGGVTVAALVQHRNIDAGVSPPQARPSQPWAAEVGGVEARLGPTLQGCPVPRRASGPPWRVPELVARAPAGSCAQRSGSLRASG